MLKIWTAVAAAFFSAAAGAAVDCQTTNGVADLTCLQTANTSSLYAAPEGETVPQDKTCTFNYYDSYDGRSCPAGTSDPHCLPTQTLTLNPGQTITAYIAKQAASCTTDILPINKLAWVLDSHGKKTGFLGYCSAVNSTVLANQCNGSYYLMYPLAVGQTPASAGIPAQYCKQTASGTWMCPNALKMAQSITCDGRTGDVIGVAEAIYSTPCSPVNGCPSENYTPETDQFADVSGVPDGFYNYLMNPGNDSAFTYNLYTQPFASSKNGGCKSYKMPAVCNNGIWKRYQTNYKWGKIGSEASKYWYGTLDASTGLANTADTSMVLNPGGGRLSQQSVKFYTQCAEIIDGSCGWSKFSCNIPGNDYSDKTVGMSKETGTWTSSWGACSGTSKDSKGATIPNSGSQSATKTHFMEDYDYSTWYCAGSSAKGKIPSGSSSGQCDYTQTTKNWSWNETLTQSCP